MSRGLKVEELFTARGVKLPVEFFFRVFKRERLLEVWARDAGAAAHVLITSYPMCGISGTLGPKRREGDLQIPEGFYVVDLFNPASNYHLSLRVDYPNAVDRARSGAASPGGDIFIHGDCVTVGCVAVSDRWMEEIYLMAITAREAGQDRIPVHMFPTRLDEDGMAWLRRTYGPGHPDMPFWETLRRGHLLFEETGVLPVVEHKGGSYVFVGH